MITQIRKFFQSSLRSTKNVRSNLRSNKRCKSNMQMLLVKSSNISTMLLVGVAPMHFSIRRILRTLQVSFQEISILLICRSTICKMNITLTLIVKIDKTQSPHSMNHRFSIKLIRLTKKKTASKEWSIRGTQAYLS